jgi:beta-glucosidase
MERDIEKIVSNMTLEEKVALCSGLDPFTMKGVERLGVPSIAVSDGPHGLRKQDKASDILGINDSLQSTCFPTAATLACSFDRELIDRVGKALGDECQAQDISILLGPAVNIKRAPLCGRNFEYFSEDPYLTSEMAKAYIDGIQARGVGACIKHFAANNQEDLRLSIDVRADERTLREIYLAAFEGAVRDARPWTVMCAYSGVRISLGETAHQALKSGRRFRGFI